MRIRVDGMTYDVEEVEFKRDQDVHILVTYKSGSTSHFKFDRRIVKGLLASNHSLTNHSLVKLAFGALA